MDFFRAAIIFNAVLQCQRQCGDWKQVFLAFSHFRVNLGERKKKTSGMIFSEKAKLGGIAPPLASVDLRPGSDKGPDDWPMGGPVPPSLT